MIPQVHPGRRKTRGEAPGLVRFDYQFLLLTHFTHKTRNWGTGVKQIKAPGRPCYYFHPGMNHLSQMVRAEQGLPKALGQLTKLRLLDLRDCFHLKVIARNVLSSLIRLEELYMGNCFVEWEVERANSERSNASLDELMHLPRLTTLEIDVKNDSILPEGFLARKLERFKISIGNESFTHPMIAGQNWFESRLHFLIDSDRKSLRELKLKLAFTDICSMKLQGINNVEYLLLDKLRGIKNVLFNLDTEGFSQLKVLWVQNNPDFFCIVDSREMVACDAFPLLESLILHNLINMERICIDLLKVESFNELKNIEAYNCDKLSNIFWLSTTKCLPRLERIAVVNCSKMKEIFAIGEEVDNAIEKIEFAQLRSLSLGNFPETIVAHKLAREWHEEADITRAYLDKAARKMKKWADTRRRHVKYKEGDQVMIKLLPQQFKTLRKVHKGLVRHYEGPFRVVRRVGNVSYQLQLPPRLKIHPVFHVSLLKPYHEDMGEPSRGESRHAPTAVVTAFDKDVDYIIADRTISRRGVPAHNEYLVKWKNLPESKATWEREDDLWQFAEHIQNFKHESATRTPRA
ncbi:hypothetical protein KPL70_014459 [Citrus sinensis]|nr:hypothetical protein KPL70_014459 [Citrus sinensis]